MIGYVLITGLVVLAYGIGLWCGAAWPHRSCEYCDEPIELDDYVRTDTNEIPIRW
jgi:hypothetical protein